MSWGADEWSAFGQLLGAGASIVATGIAAYSALQAKKAAQSSDMTAKRAERALALAEQPLATVEVFTHPVSSIQFGVRLDRDVTWTVTLRRQGRNFRRETIVATHSTVEIREADEVMIEFVERSGRRWRWASIPTHQSIFYSSAAHDANPLPLEYVS